MPQKGCLSSSLLHDDARNFANRPDCRGLTISVTSCRTLILHGSQVAKATRTEDVHAMKWESMVSLVRCKRFAAEGQRAKQSCTSRWVHRRQASILASVTSTSMTSMIATMQAVTGKVIVMQSLPFWVRSVPLRGLRLHHLCGLVRAQ